MQPNQLPTPANNNVSPAFLFAGSAVLDAHLETALDQFVIALARNQARIDHLQAMSAADDNTIH
ncbi:hypothetical protein L6654_36615 [Bradyrhizobium sp. WYCCWR 13023]|uniref:Uncharacterized protein n=1 Tax=Bradyrhizobium zhengyangense TaxID=2911009 RepID=A0A9X1UJT8_9BRAD|nr:MULTISPECIES: hypothetical protein [Bradyrhizobium]MCG2632147.1 hypothetical protein [Bradyrhizobium zhengyangense]MCG2639594.1 hypothetical protein [Bradyrhizobium zhengyangense]MCG2672916.1 hypothetical protein [Bradyrhizobium zhengyangense]